MLERIFANLDKVCGDTTFDAKMTFSNRPIRLYSLNIDGPRIRHDSVWRQRRYILPCESSRNDALSFSRFDFRMVVIFEWLTKLEEWLSIIRLPCNALIVNG